jgi:hypothetical protein
MLRLVAQGDVPPAAGRTTRDRHPFVSVLSIAAVTVLLVLVANVDNIVAYSNVTALVAISSSTRRRSASPDKAGPARASDYPAESRSPPSPPSPASPSFPRSDGAGSPSGSAWSPRASCSTAPGTGSASVTAPSQPLPKRSRRLRPLARAMSGRHTAAAPRPVSQLLASGRRPDELHQQPNKHER